MLTVQQNTTKAFNVYFGVSGLTVTATLSKNGGAFNSVSPGIVDRSNGYYSITPITAHRDTIGENAWLFSASGQPSLPRVEQVIAADIDAAIQPVNVTRWLDKTVSVDGDDSPLVSLAAKTHTGAVIPTVTSVTGSVGSVAGNVTGSVGSVVGNVGGNVAGSVGSVVGAVGSVTAGVTVATIGANVITASALATDAVTEIQAGVRTELATELGRIDAAISSRASQTSVDGKPTLAQIEASTVLPTKTDVQNAGLI